MPLVWTDLHPQLPKSQVDVPVELAEIVTRRVGAVIGELRGRSRVGHWFGPREAGDDGIERRQGQPIKRPHGGGDRATPDPGRTWIDTGSTTDRGRPGYSGTRSSASAMIAS